ncbi:MAG: sigma-70 family RNA polymerase sigma factor [Deltaproteobacteria bacterium]|nr:sigma-70 family RNA polymerase sigma factor [Deltaproteobacteria bacterium]
MAATTTVQAKAHAKRSKRSRKGLDAGEELALLRSWHKNKDMSARQKLVEAFMPRVEAIARGFRHYPVDHEDLVAEGSVGLLVAIDRFDASKGVRLMTYASHWIKAYIVNAIIKTWGRGKTGMGITRSRMFFRVRRERARYASQHDDFDVVVRKMAADIGVSEKRMRDMINALDTPDFSLDAYAEASGQSDLRDRIEDEAAGPDAELEAEENGRAFYKAVSHALTALDDRERLIARKRLMDDDPMTLADLGREIGVSRERARQLELRAKRKLAAVLADSGITAHTFHAAVS